MHIRQVFPGLIAGVTAYCLFLPSLSAANDLQQWQAGLPKKPNVVLIVSDDQRPDTIAALGNPAIQTPHLDRLVANGTTFTAATCAYPICTPSRAEIMTGATAFRNGVFDFGGRLNPNMETLATTLDDNGYRTCYVGKWHNDSTPSRWGYSETRQWFGGGGGRWAVPSYDWNGREITGYRGWIARRPDGTLDPRYGTGLTPNISERFATAAVEFIHDATEEPFLLHVNFPAPHDPLLMPYGYEDRYDPAAIPLPENFLPRHPFDHGNFDGRDEVLFAFPRTDEEVRRELAVYYAVISHMDAQIGRILDALVTAGIADETYVIFSSDHGLAIGSHGLRGKQNMYEHTIKVPLVISGPRIDAGRAAAAPCVLRDLFPTICDLTGTPIPATVDGRSLAPALADPETIIHPFVTGYFRDFQRMLRTDRWKLIEYPHLDKQQLFDLTEDPQELHDLASDPQQADRIRSLTYQLRAWQVEHGDPLVVPAANR